MVMFKRLRSRLAGLPVGLQLYGAFAFLLVLTAVVGAIALTALARVDDAAGSLSSKWLAGVGHLARARAAVVDARDYEVKHSRTSDRSYHAEYEDKIEEASRIANEAFKSYGALVATGDERELYTRLATSWAAYGQTQKQIIKLGRDKLQQDAADISDGAGSMGVDEALGALNALTDYNFAQSRAAAANASLIYRQSSWLVAGLLGVALLGGLGLAWAITRHLLAQLGGEPAQAVAIAHAVADGDLSSAIRLARGDQHSLMASLHSMQLGLTAAVQQVRHGSDMVASTSTQIAQSNLDLAGRTEQQTTALQQTGTTMGQLGSTVRTNADNARQANELALGASAVAVKGGEVVGQVVQTMKGINDSSRRIGEIIGVIDSIAFQTNILALNAAVEAARAGEQGRGFAVVASEVRSLAKRSADAAREIKSLISASVERVEHGSHLVDDAGRTMTEIVAAIQRVTDIVGAISSASVEQSTGVTQVGQAIAQMDEATQRNATLVQQGSIAAEALHQQAQELVQAVSVFKLAAKTSA
ncbi:MAG: hypothetical protein RL375_1973 [Pseudomonadota bacterium]